MTTKPERIATNIADAHAGFVHVATPSLRSLIAAVQHEIWAHWQVWVFEVSTANPDGSVTIPASLVTRWRRQIQTPYSHLTESEQASDLRQADKVIKVL
jgi:hypothetical protein